MVKQTQLCLNNILLRRAHGGFPRLDDAIALWLAD